MNLAKYVATAVAALVLAAPAANAIDLKMPGSKAGTASTNGADAVNMQQGLVARYVEAASYMNATQIELAKAFELKEQAAALEAEAAVLGSGATLDRDAIKKNREVSAAASAEIDQKIASGAELSAEGRQHYINSFAPLVAGASAAGKLPVEASEFSEAAQAQVKSASVMEKASVTSKLATGTYLAKEIPGFSAQTMDNFKKIVTYAQRQGIPVPPDATALLGM